MKTDKHYIDLDEVRSKSYYENLDRKGYENDNACIICGRPLDGSRSFVHMTVDGNITDLPYDEVGEDNSQGYFEIGKTCAKKLPKSFVTILDPAND